MEPNYYAVIPANVRYSDCIPNAKLLFGEITALCNKEGYCWASDNYFAELYKVSNRSIQSWLTSLEDSGFIRREVKYKKGTKEIEKRKIYIADLLKKTSYPSEENFSTPSEENFRENNTSINTTINTLDNKLSNGLEPKKIEKYGNNEINEIFDYWESVVGYKLAGNIKRNRYAANNLLKKHGIEATKQLIDGVAVAQTDKFAPRVGDFAELQSNINKLIAWGRKQTTATRKGVKL